MVKSKTSRYIILSILFFLPVIFLLLLYPAQHNYEPLDVVEQKVSEISISNDLKLEDHITVLAFLGKNPMDNIIAASNLKELVYDKFKGFKKFQVVAISPQLSKPYYEEFDKEIRRYENLKYWHYAYHTDEDVISIYNSLKSNNSINKDLATNNVFIIDKDLNQRGRLDDRTDKEIEKNKPVYGLYSYDCISVDVIKNKMSDDMRILFTEYRQKRKGNFDSSSRRASDLKE